LTRANGTATGLIGSIVIPANGQTATFLNQIPGLASLPLPFQGVMRISSTSQISVIGLRARYNERADFLITTLVPVQETLNISDELYFPHFADSGGYTTQFILMNNIPGQSSGVLRLFNQSGEALNLVLQ
jgi:hypothetical protein